MANKITLTFAGNIKPLKRELDKVPGFMRKLKDDAERGTARMNLFGKGSGFFNKLAELPKVVGSAFSSLPVTAQAPVVAAGAALGALFAAPIGAAITAAVLLAVGGGVLAIGISRAVKDPRVKAAWAPLAETARGALDKLGSHFVGPLERAAKDFQPVVGKLGPMADRLGAALAPVVGKLSPALAGMADKILPSLERAALASVPLFEKLAEKAPMIGDAIARFFDTIAANGPMAEKFFGRVLDAITISIHATSTFIDQLVFAYTWLERLWGLTKANFALLGSAISGLGSLIAALWRSLDFSGAFNSLWQSARTNINKIIGAWNRLEFRIGGGSFLGMDIPAFTLSTPNLPTFHHGGKVPGAPGQEVLSVLQAGETVVPAGRAAGVTVVIEVSGSSDADRAMAAWWNRLQRNGQLNVRVA